MSTRIRFPPNVHVSLNFRLEARVLVSSRRKVLLATKHLVGFNRAEEDGLVAGKFRLFQGATAHVSGSLIGKVGIDVDSVDLRGGNATEVGEVVLLELN